MYDKFDTNMKKLHEVPEAAHDFIGVIKEKCGKKNKKWADIFEKVFSNTLETTIKRINENTTYVLTGDIPAMWLRDSTAQVRPYLVMAQYDQEVADIIKGVVNQQFIFINHDPYANAFNETPNSNGHQDDKTEMTPLIWERKYEIDSLAYPLQLAYLYYCNTKDKSVFNDNYIKGVKKILKLWTLEQNHENSTYRFERDTERSEDTLSNNGKGAPVAYTGMTWSGFRPSDDACVYNYLVPSNMFAVVVLEYVIEVFSEINIDRNIVKDAQRLRKEIQEGIEKHAIVDSPVGKIYAYEVDGLGNYNLIDDPNVPSLLSAPYLGYCDTSDEVYSNTRDFILSEHNPYFYSGEYGSGCGSSHTPENYIWPIALSITGLTSESQKEKESILNNLAMNTAGTNMMHESFDVNNPHNYTREWFSWANMMFCELVMDYCGFRVKS